MKTTKRPVQTYGKRAVSAATGKENQPPLKRQRSDDLESPRASTKRTRREISDAPLLPMSVNKAAPNDLSRPVSTTEPARSILSYFQRLQSTSRPALAGSSPSAMDDPTPSSAPPPSPPTSRRHARPRRRLNSRPQGKYEEEFLENREVEGLSQSRLATEGPQVESKTAPGGDSARRRVESIVRGKSKGKRKRKSHQLTQTTLSLAIDEKPAFTVCDVCHILYNPLNEKDRLEHSRRHAAYCRAAKRLRNAHGRASRRQSDSDDSD
jgi:hypothetical protein